MVTGLHWVTQAECSNSALKCRLRVDTVEKVSRKKLWN